MSLSLAPHLRTITRFARLASHIDAHLDDELTLAVLSDVAELSRHRLDREFTRYACEAPMERVRRLRLLRAALCIAEHPERPLLDVALDAGYASAAAFTRAFGRAHGVPPKAFRNAGRGTPPTLRIEYLPEMAIQCIPYQGKREDLRDAANELRARAMACGIDPQRRFGWQVDVRANLLARDAATPINLEAALLHAPLGERIPGLDCDLMPGGHYAVFGFCGVRTIPPEAVLTTRIRHETGWMPTDGTWLRRCRNKRFLPSVLEGRFELYIPVRPQARAEIASARPFMLER